MNDLTHNKKIFYFAHRGAPLLKPENTIKSFEKAIELGCNGIEMDIQLTGDNQIIILHDNYIVKNKTKNYIHNLSYSNIKKLCNNLKIDLPRPI